MQEAARKEGSSIDCSMVESERRLGGKILTEKLDGFTVEAGPDSFLTQKPWAIDLCQRLGYNDRLIGINPLRHKTYLLHKRKLVEFPEVFMTVAPVQFMAFLRAGLLSPWGKIRMVLDMLIPPRRDRYDESLASYIRRRLGREALEKIAEPLMAGIFAGDAEQLSMMAAFPQLYELELGYGGLTAGLLKRKRKGTPTAGSLKRRAMFMTLIGGMSELVDALHAQLTDVSILIGRKAVGLRQRFSRKNLQYELELEDGAVLLADAVVLATPGYVTAGLLEQLSPPAATILKSIPYVSIANVSLGYKRIDFAHPLDGYGFFVPRNERRKITACTWTSSKWPSSCPSDHIMVKCHLGRAGQEDVLNLSDDELIQVARDELRELLGVTSKPVLVRIYRWEKSMPQYLVGHLDKLTALEKILAEQTGVFLTGAAYRGVGLPDCINQGEVTAAKVLTYLKKGLSLRQDG